MNQHTSPQSTPRIAWKKWQGRSKLAIFLLKTTYLSLRLPRWYSGKESASQCRFLSCEDPLEEGMATHSRILAWKILWTEEPGGLQTIGSQRVRHN